MNSTVVIAGEDGTGEELIDRAIYKRPPSGAGARLGFCLNSGAEDLISEDQQVPLQTV